MTFQHAPWMIPSPLPAVDPTHVAFIVPAERAADVASAIAALGISAPAYHAQPAQQPPEPAQPDTLSPGTTLYPVERTGSADPVALGLPVQITVRSFVDIPASQFGSVGVCKACGCCDAHWRVAYAPKPLVGAPTYGYLVGCSNPDCQCVTRTV